MVGVGVLWELVYDWLVYAVGTFVGAEELPCPVERSETTKTKIINVSDVSKGTAVIHLRKPDNSDG
jgi:hypothetical protein